MKQPTSTPLRVLVVDDLPDCLESLALLVRLWGHEVRTTHDGPSALTAAEQFHPDVVLLDIAMPRMDGYQVAQGLRQVAGLESVYLVATTGFGRSVDVRRSQEAGFDAHLTKPLETEALQKVLAFVAARQGP